jgi:sporulation protein YlmC with PRC-barrel domain
LTVKAEPVSAVSRFAVITHEEFDVMKNLSEQIRSMTSTMTAIALIGVGAASYEFGRLDAFAQDTGVIAGEEEKLPADEMPAASDPAQANQPDELSETKSNEEGQAVTAERSPQATGQDIFVVEQGEGDVLANEYIGRAIYNADAERVGDVNDLVFSKDGGISAVIVGVGGFLGLGEKAVAIRFDAIEIREDTDAGTMVLMINSSQDELEAAPAFVSMAQKMAEERAAEIERQQTKGELNPNPTLPVPEPAPNNDN